MQAKQLRITLTPKQKAALETASMYAHGIYSSNKVAGNNHAHISTVGHLRQCGFLKRTMRDEFIITPLGLQWLADDAQPAVVKPEALPEHITSRLPEGYMS